MRPLQAEHAMCLSRPLSVRSWISSSGRRSLLNPSYSQSRQLRNELQARREAVKLPQTMDELVECLEYTGRTGPLKRKIPKNVVNVGQLKGGVDACLELSEREKAAAMVRLQEIQDDRFDRMRFQNHLVEGLLRKDGDRGGCGMLDSIQKLDDGAANAMLDSSSPAVFAGSLRTPSTALGRSLPQGGVGAADRGLPAKGRPSSNRRRRERILRHSRSNSQRLDWQGYGRVSNVAQEGAKNKETSKGRDHG